MRPRAKRAKSEEDTLQHLEDFQLVERCLHGDEEAIRHLQTAFGPQVVAFLIRSGAEVAHAEEIVGQLWADLVVATPGSTPRLARYDGSCQLMTWLNTVAVNRLLSARRSQKRVERYVTTSLDADRDGQDGGEKTLKTQLAAPVIEPSERPLVDLLRGAIQAAFASCAAEDFVLLQLAYGDGLRVRELGLIWGCNASTISRRLAQAANEVEQFALAYMRAADPLLELTWGDFVELCRSANLGALGFE